MSLANIRDGALKKLTGGEGLLKMLWSKMLCNNGYFESAVENQIRMVTDLSSSSISHALAIKCIVGLTTLMLQSTPSPRKSIYVCRLTTNRVNRWQKNQLKMPFRLVKEPFSC